MAEYICSNCRSSRTNTRSTISRIGRSGWSAGTRCSGDKKLNIVDCWVSWPRMCIKQLYLNMFYKTRIISRDFFSILLDLGDRRHQQGESEGTIHPGRSFQKLDGGFLIARGAWIC